MKSLKDRISNGELLIGCWLNLGSSISAEIVGLAGFDWVLVDFEHGSDSEKDVLLQLQALEHTNAAPIVRVESFARQRIHRMLDFGAEGIMVPRIETPAEAQLAAKALRYQPDGLRGVARMVRASQYGYKFDQYFQISKSNIVGVIQIETVESLNHLGEISRLDGVDVIFIGPMDLSTALGITGKWDHPTYCEVIKETAKAAKKAGKAAGILLPHPDEFSKYYDLGYRFIASGSDIGFISNGARNIVQTLIDKKNT